MTDVANNLPGSALLDADKQLTLFCNFDAKLYHTTLGSDGAWSPWLDLGGPVDFEAPVAVLSVPFDNPSSPILTVMNRGANGRLIYRTCEHGWGEWRDTEVEVDPGGGLAAVPTHALAMVWGRQPGGRLWHMRALSSAPGGVDHGVIDALPNPVAIRQKDEIYCFVRKPDRSVWSLFMTIGESPRRLESLGGNISSGLGVATNLAGSVRIFGRGDDGALWWTYQEHGGKWRTPWVSLHGQITSAPAAYVDARQENYVFARGKSGVLEYAYSNMGPWTELAPLVPNDFVALDSAPLVVPYPDRAAVFARALDGSIRWLFFTPRGGAPKWQAIAPPRG